MDSLQGATTVKQIRKALEHSPSSLSGAYESTFMRINRQSPSRAQIAFRVLAWISGVFRPLSATELQHGLAIEAHSRDMDEENLCSQKIMVDCCMGLIVVSEVDRLVRLAHLTIRDFFLEKYRTILNDQRSELTEACMTYLAYRPFSDETCDSAEEIESRLRNFPFLDYAANTWGRHAQRLQVDLRDNILALLRNESALTNATDVLHYRERRRLTTPEAAFDAIPRRNTAIRTAAYWGLNFIVHALCDEISDLSPRDSHCWSPLHWAAARGHLDVVKTLIEKGADMQCSDNMQWTPLFWAVQRRRTEVVAVLLEHGAYVYRRDSKGWTVFHLAVFARDIDVLEKLLRYGQGDFNVADSRGVTPLNLAAQNGNEAVLQFLTDLLARPSSVRVDEEDLMSAADSSDVHDFESKVGLVKNKYKDWKSLSLDKMPWGVNEQTLCQPYWFFLRWDGQSLPTFKHYLLHSAVIAKQQKICSALIALKVDTNVIYRNGQTFLHTAAACSNDAILSLLLSTGVDPTKADRYGQTALHYAITSGNWDAATTLVSCSGLLGVQDDKGQTALHLLFLKPNPRMRIVRALFPESAVPTLGLLCDHGANVNIQDLEGSTALHLAASLQHVEAIRRLLNSGSDLTLRDHSGKQALHHLVSGYRGRRDRDLLGILHVFLGKGVDINAADHGGHTPLSIAFDSSCWDAAFTLMDCGATVCQPTLLSRALFTAVKDADMKTVEKLYSAGSPANIANDDGERLLITGIRRYKHLLDSLRRDLETQKAGSGELKAVIAYRAEDYNRLVLLLLRNGEDVNSADTANYSALHAALESEDMVAVVETLLAYGANSSASSTTGTQPIHVAAGNGCLAYVRLLIDLGVDCNARNDAGQTALSIAAANGYVPIVECLAPLQHPAHLLTPAESKIDWFATAKLANAVSSNDADTFSDLQGLQVEVSGADINGLSLLHKAANFGTLEMCATLIYLGAKVDDADFHGRTPLHVAAGTGHTAIVRFLLENRANLTARTNASRPRGNINSPRGAIALHLAAWRGHIDVIEAMLNFSKTSTTSNVKLYIDDGSDGCNRTALMMAAYRGYTNIVKLLLAEGADVNASGGYGSWGFGAIDMAVEGNNDDIVELLAESGAREDWYTSPAACDAIERAEKKRSSKDSK